MSLDSLGERVAYVLDQSGHSPSSAARIIGCERAAISQWIHGPTENIKNAFLFALADLTGFEARWIATGKGPKRPLDKYSVDNIQQVVAAMEKMPPYAQDLARKLVEDVGALPIRAQLKVGTDP